MLLAVLLGAACGDEALDPQIEALLPAAAAPGELLDLVGQRLQGDQVQVHVGGALAVVRLSQPGRLRLQVPQLPPGLTLVVVTVDGRPSAPADFEVR